MTLKRLSIGWGCVCVCVWIWMAGGAAWALTADPSSVALSSGGTQDITLSGGTGFYTVSSSDESVATAVYAGNVVTITAKAKGSAVITITDSSNDTATVSVDVDKPFSATAGTVHLEKGTTQDVTLGQGSPPFTVSSSPKVTAGISGTTLTLTGKDKGTATLTVTDSVSASVAITVVVFLPLAVVPDVTTISLADNVDRSFTITEGIPPYSVTSDDDTIASVSVKNDTALTVTGESLGSTQITVSDSASPANTLVLDAQVKSFNVTETSISLGLNQDKSINILNSGTGYYNLSVADSAIASAKIATSGSDTVVEISGLSKGKTVVTLENSAGDTVDISVTVTGTLTVSDTTLTLDDGTQTTLQVSGGTYPYTIAASTAGVVDVPASWGVLPFDVKAVGPGTTVLTITDTQSDSVTVTVTVNAVSLGLGVSDISVARGAEDSVSVIGGTGFYLVTSADPTVVDASLTTDAVKLVGLKTGKTTVTVTDSGGDTADLAVTVRLPAPVLTHQVTGTVVSLTWTAVSGADAYLIFWVPPDSQGDPDVSLIDCPNQDHCLNLGKLTALTGIDLGQGADFHVAVMALNFLNPEVSSDISNAAHVTTP